MHASTTEATPSGDRRADLVGSLGDELLTCVLRLKRLGGRVLDHWQVEVTMSELAVLGRLHQHSAQRLSELAGWSQLDPSSASRQIADLVDRGLLERVTDPDDGRARLLTLTDKGRDLLAEVVRQRNEFFGDALDTWSDDDVAQLYHLLHRLGEDVGALGAATVPNA